MSFSYLICWIPLVDSIWLHVFCCNATNSQYCIIVYCHTWADNSLCPNPSTIVNHYRCISVKHVVHRVIVVSSKQHAPCEMQTLLPMLTLSRLSIQTSSPIQQSSPISNFHGNFTVTSFFMTSPFPIFAPNRRNREIFIPINGFHEARTNNAFTKYHNACFINPAPLSNPSGENADKSHFSTIIS